MRMRDRAAKVRGAEKRRAHCNDGQFSVLLVFNSLFQDSILTPKNSTFSYYLPSMVLFWHYEPQNDLSNKR